MSMRELDRREREARIRTSWPRRSKHERKPSRANRDRPASAWRHPQWWVLLLAAIGGLGYPAAVTWSKAEIAADRAAFHKNDLSSN